MPHELIMCQQLQALLAQENDGSTMIELEDMIAQHIAHCAVCAACEQALTLMIDDYRHVEQPLNEALEHRLLDQMCRDRVS